MFPLKELKVHRIFLQVWYNVDVTQKSGRSRLQEVVVYESFLQVLWFHLETFGDLDWGDRL